MTSTGYRSDVRTDLVFGSAATFEAVLKPYLHV